MRPHFVASGIMNTDSPVSASCEASIETIDSVECQSDAGGGSSSTMVCLCSRATSARRPCIEVALLHAASSA